MCRFVEGRDLGGYVMNLGTVGNSKAVRSAALQNLAALAMSSVRSSTLGL
jgi:hypothetical protein